MKEIKLWKMALLWFGTQFLAGFCTILYYEFTFQEVNDLVLIFNTFSVTLLFTLISGNVNLSLIKERFNNFKRVANIKEIFGVVITQIFLSMGLSYLSIAFVASTDKTKALQVLNDTFGNPTNNTEFVLWVISIVILAPILEEIVFRRVIFKRLNIKFSFMVSAVISSLIFGIGHEFLGVIGAIVFGVACCILYVKYNNILVPIAVHFINNLLAAITEAPSYFNGTMNETITSISNSDIKFWLLSGISLTLITLIIFTRFIIANKSYIQNKKRYLQL